MLSGSLRTACVRSLDPFSFSIHSHAFFFFGLCDPLPSPCILGSSNILQAPQFRAMWLVSSRDLDDLPWESERRNMHAKTCQLCFFKIEPSNSPWTNGFHHTVSRLWGPMIYIIVGPFTCYAKNVRIRVVIGSWGCYQGSKIDFRFEVKLAARHE